MTTQALEKLPAGNSLAIAEVPDYLKGKVGQATGTEDIGKDDLIIPRLALAQQLSPQINKKKEEFIAGLEIGQMFNSLTSKVYGTVVNVVPLFFFHTFIKFKPIADGGGVVKMYDRREDVPSEELIFGEKGPATTEFKNWMCLIVSEGEAPEPIVVSFKSTSLKTCRKWNSFIRQTKLPAYAKVYQIDSVTQSKGDLEWEGFKVTPGAFVPEGFFTQAEKYFNQLKASGVKVDTTGMEGSDSTDNGTGDTSF